MDLPGKQNHNHPPTLTPFLKPGDRPIFLTEGNPIDVLLARSAENASHTKLNPNAASPTKTSKVTEGTSSSSTPGKEEPPTNFGAGQVG